MIYIASPYDHPDDEVRQMRYRQVVAFTAQQAQAGHMVYSPICHWHPIAEAHDLPKGFEWWQKMDFHVIGRCDALWVLRLSGWSESRGVKAEIDHALQLGLPVEYHDEL